MALTRPELVPGVKTESITSARRPDWAGAILRKARIEKSGGGRASWGISLAFGRDMDWERADGVQAKRERLFAVEIALELEVELEHSSIERTSEPALVRVLCPSRQYKPRRRVIREGGRRQTHPIGCERWCRQYPDTERQQ